MKMLQCTVVRNILTCLPLCVVGEDQSCSKLICRPRFYFLVRVVKFLATYAAFTIILIMLYLQTEQLKDSNFFQKLWLGFYIRISCLTVCRKDQFALGWQISIQLDLNRFLDFKLSLPIFLRRIQPCHYSLQVYHSRISTHCSSEVAVSCSHDPVK